MFAFFKSFIALASFLIGPGPGSEVIKLFFRLNSTEHENKSAYKDLLIALEIFTFLAFKLTYAVFIRLINVKLPTIVAQLS